MTSSPVSPEPLPISHIQVGNYIWYGGRTSQFGWDCPAEIYRVLHAERIFFVKSLDDMREQSQPYSFEIGEHSPDSRKSMRAITFDDAMAFLSEKLSARRMIENPGDPEFPYAVEFDSPEEKIPTGMDFDADYPPAKLNSNRQEFLRIWAKKNGFTISFDHRDRALFRCEDDAVLCRLSILDRQTS